ncbi:unnamed protein product, partial [Tilletia controversa]
LLSLLSLRPFLHAVVSPNSAAIIAPRHTPSFCDDTLDLSTFFKRAGTRTSSSSATTKCSGALFPPPASSTHMRILVTDINADFQLGLCTHTPAWGGTQTPSVTLTGLQGRPASRTFALVR